MKVLLVEDNEGDARLLRLHLAEAAGASVQIESAHRLSDALARLAAESFDAVLIDLGLSDSQGLDTYRRVAQQAANTAVVVMSGLEQPPRRPDRHRREVRLADSGSKQIALISSDWATILPGEYRAISY